METTRQAPSSVSGEEASSQPIDDKGALVVVAPAITPATTSTATAAAATAESPRTSELLSQACASPTCSCMPGEDKTPFPGVPPPPPLSLPPVTEAAGDVVVTVEPPPPPPAMLNDQDPSEEGFIGPRHKEPSALPPPHPPHALAFAPAPAPLHHSQQGDVDQWQDHEQASMASKRPTRQKPIPRIVQDAVERLSSGPNGEGDPSVSGTANAHNHSLADEKRGAV